MTGVIVGDGEKVKGGSIIGVGDAVGVGEKTTTVVVIAEGIIHAMCY